MRDYVIINGVSSLNKTGLAIKTLPSITKPLMRAYKEEIDGRNGDLITELGYAAYDKQLEIGLFGNFDINNIISYFSNSGTITFSNETDKYYYFQIINQIDYEKLLKFKTAVVTLHCQPFKYKVNESPITLTSGDNTITNNGNIYAKPIITIVGSGTITISLGGNQIFSIDMSNNSKIVIDTANLEAYDPDTGDLLNRIVTGDYELFKIESGSNTLNISGTITTATLTNYQRWL